jgi:hypothetical protein
MVLRFYCMMIVTVIVSIWIRFVGIEESIRFVSKERERESSRNQKISLTNNEEDLGCGVDLYVPMRGASSNFNSQEFI